MLLHESILVFCNMGATELDAMLYPLKEEKANQVRKILDFFFLHPYNFRNLVSATFYYKKYCNDLYLKLNYFLFLKIISRSALTAELPTRRMHQ